jgi:hypothetical protein
MQLVLQSTYSHFRGSSLAVWVYSCVSLSGAGPTQKRIEAVVLLSKSWYPYGNGDEQAKGA